MRLALALLCSILHAAVTNAAYTGAADERDVRNGMPLLNSDYADQAYCVVAYSSAEAPRWVCVVTLSGQSEGGNDETVVSTFSDDNGTTWSTPIPIVSPSPGVPVAYGVPVAVQDSSSTRFIGVIYNINADNVTTLPDGTPLARHDEMGHFRLQVSVDRGQTWMSQPYEVPYRLTPVDSQNQWNGKVKLMWDVDKPTLLSEAEANDLGVAPGFYVAFTKIGHYIQDPPEEVWFLHSPNFATVSSFEDLTWELLPDGEHGVQNPLNATTGVCEEGHLVVGSQSFWSMFRTEDGYLGCSYSRDGGRSWGHSEWCRYASGGSVKNPRGPITPRRFSNGKYLLLYYNNGFPEPTYRNRNPYWLAAGWDDAASGSVVWSQPEIILYDRSQTEYDECCGYPDFIEMGNRVWIVETNKKTAATHLINSTLLQGLWDQNVASAIPASPATVLSAADVGKNFSAPRTANFSRNDGVGEGFTFEFFLSAHNHSMENQILLEISDSTGVGVKLAVTAPNSTVAITLNDGVTPTSENATFFLDSECASVLADPSTEPHYLATVVDGGPRIVTWMVDGVLCDGGAEQRQGWAWFNTQLGNVDTHGSGGLLRLAPDYGGNVVLARSYARALRVSELVASWRHGQGEV